MSKPRNRSTQEHLDLWQGSHFSSWIGPTIPPEAPDYARKMAQLERVFQSANILAECATNWRDGLVSEQFNWHLKGQDGQRADTTTDSTAAEAELELQRWLDWINQQAVTADPKATNFMQADVWSEFVLSLGVLGQGALRLWQPARYADDPDPVKRIHLHAPKAGSVTVDRNADDGFIDAIAYTYGQNKKETQTMDGDVVRVAVEGDEGLEVDSGGRWLVQHVTGESIFTPSAKRLQNALNHALTMTVRNNEVAGFREKTFLNAEYPTDEQGNPIEIERGPGKDLWLYGVPSGTDQAGYNTVGVHESQPVDVKSLSETIQIYRSLIYLEFGQGHLLSTSDGGLSGESRIQMRQAFELRLRGWQRRVEGAIAAILNIVLRILGYEQYEVVVGLHITTGKLSAEERASVISEFQAGLVSKATAIAQLGSVKDVDAELALLMEEAEEGMQRRDIPNEALPNPLTRVALEE